MCKKSLWVRWIHSYKLKGRNIWDVHAQWNISWGWRKILQIRKHIRHFPWVQIGTGCNTSVWFDKWDIHWTLIDHLTLRIVSRAGFCLEDRVADLVVCPGLTQDMQDNVVWILQDGKMKDFSVRSAWDSIRARSNEVTWFFVVCFSSSIPRYGFHLWLVMRKRLKTHDELKQKDVGNNVDLNLLRCPLCKTVTPPFLHIAAEANLGYYFKNQKPLPKDILGITTLRDARSHYPKGCWESLPEEILGATTQRDTRSLYLKRCWESLPEEMLGVFTRRNAFMWVPLP
ncbi:putative reverse transcriptase domain-containing protein [Tanacetum coccineum]